MLYCAALQHVSVIPEEKFEIIDVEGFDEEHLEFLWTCENRCEVLLQWIQRLIVEKHLNALLKIPPPILSRVFQELSRGIVNLNNVRKISEIPFPFPYSQMIVAMLIAHSFLAPIIACATLSGPVECFAATFLVVLVFWAINYVAEEIEQPFGDDDNDLPIPEMLRELNMSLRLLLEPQAQKPPCFTLTEEHLDMKLVSADHRITISAELSSFCKSSMRTRLKRQREAAHGTRGNDLPSRSSVRLPRRSLNMDVQRISQRTSQLDVQDCNPMCKQPSRNSHVSMVHTHSDISGRLSVAATPPRNDTPPRVEIQSIFHDVDAESDGKCLVDNDPGHLPNTQKAKLGRLEDIEALRARLRANARGGCGKMLPHSMSGHDLGQDGNPGTSISLSALRHQGTTLSEDRIDPPAIAEMQAFHADGCSAATERTNKDSENGCGSCEAEVEKKLERGASSGLYFGRKALGYIAEQPELLV
eukprot:TRINITY_DN1881_c1_g2_i1.p1 TRINITY_DN1881_c1_g2~~TRINITY_DN1881_c1_g2_i1.p1  ORF type:complete len:473 (+),score=77.25 TRINITY_DN1881_c1_g2_i1:2-1420(+)